MNYKLRTNKAFTLIELVVAVALLTMVISFSSVIFKVSINAYRTSSANAEIMQKLQVITDQLNRDFEGLRKDGYLILRSEIAVKRLEFKGSQNLADFRTDQLYYFTTGDFQSWFEPYRRSNIARIYFGHDSASLSNPLIPASKWRLIRDVRLITPRYSNADCNNISYAQLKADTTAAESLLTTGIVMDVLADPNDIRSLMCQNVGEMKIVWTDGTIDSATGELIWWGLGWPIGGAIATAINESDIADPPYYWASWTPYNSIYWPKALKFTFLRLTFSF